MPSTVYEGMVIAPSQPAYFDVAKLIAVTSPFKTIPWDGCEGADVLMPEDVWDALRSGRLVSERWTSEGPYDWDLAKHARRVAYLMAYGWDDPIELDFWPRNGEPGPYLIDGNHRLCAAHLLKVPGIAGHWGGPWKRAQEFVYCGSSRPQATA